MIGHTSKQRLARKAELANKPALPDKPLIPWMEATAPNITWLAEQVFIGCFAGHEARKVIEETINGKKTGRIALARKI